MDEKRENEIAQSNMESPRMEEHRDEDSGVSRKNTFALKTDIVAEDDLTVDKKDGGPRLQRTLTFGGRTSSFRQVERAYMRKEGRRGKFSFDILENVDDWKRDQNGRKEENGRDREEIEENVYERLNLTNFL